jgi:hypothetical protein
LWLSAFTVLISSTDHGFGRSGLHSREIANAAHFFARQLTPGRRKRILSIWEIGPHLSETANAACSLPASLLFAAKTHQRYQPVFLLLQ